MTRKMDKSGNALLSLKAKKFYQRTGKNIIINGSDITGYDKSKVECFNCHKMGHFARECRGPRNQESRPRNQESSKRTVNVVITSCFKRYNGFLTEMLQAYDRKQVLSTQIIKTLVMGLSIKELGDIMEKGVTTASTQKQRRTVVVVPGAKKLYGDVDAKLYGPQENPTQIYASFIKQFWRTTTARTSASGEVELTATIDGQEKTITEASLRIHLKLEDNGDFFNPTQEPILLPQKVFSNMKRVTKGYSREDIPLFASMITASETSPSRITSSPSLSPQHTSFTAPSTSQPSNIHTTPVTKEAASMPYESPLQSVHLLGRDEGSLSLHELMVLLKKLEQTCERRDNLEKTRVYTSDEEERFRRRLVMILREWQEKRKDKGKAIMIEDESVQKKSKKQLEQERLKYDKSGKKEAVAEVDTAHVIDWNDYSIISYDDIRTIFEKVWDQVHSFVPMDSEESSKIQKSWGQDVEGKPAKRQRTEEVSESAQEQTYEEPKTDECLKNN
ncbi:ribonuclease H-like domain-containing protein [Tanacetum coccineum]